MTNPKPGTGGQRGARPVGGANDGAKKKPWWLLALLAVVAIIVLILLLSRCGSGDDAATSAVSSATSAVSSATSKASSAASSATSQASSATTSATATSPGTAGTATSPLTANGTGLLPLTTAAPDGTLTAFVGQTATSAGVTVQSVPADEGFWVGTSATDRVWVQIIGGGESPYKVTQGDKVDFTGTVVANAADFATTVGLADADGATQLTTQAAHIEVAQGGVTLTK